MYSLYYVCSYLYLITSVIVAPVGCIAFWLLLAHAANKRLQIHVRWLLPMAVGSTLTTAAIFSFTVNILWRRHDLGLVAVSYLLSVGSALLGLLALVRLWQMVHGTPPSRGGEAPRGEGHRGEGQWPPAPKRD